MTKGRLVVVLVVLLFVFVLVFVFVVVVSDGFSGLTRQQRQSWGRRRR